MSLPETSDYELAAWGLDADYVWHLPADETGSTAPTARCSPWPLVVRPLPAAGFMHVCARCLRIVSHHAVTTEAGP